MGQIGLGLYGFSGVYGEKDPVLIEEMLLKAVEAGVDYFDVAPVYGGAEEFLGRVLKPYREKIEIATKGGISVDGRPDGSYKGIKEGCISSLKRLNVEYVDYFQVHFVDPGTPVEETVEALESLEKEGLIKKYGLGHFSREKIREFCRKGKPHFILSEISPLNIDDYYKYKEFWEKYGVWVNAMGVTGRGFLSGKINAETRSSKGDIRNLDSLFHPELFDWRQGVLNELEKIGEKYQKTPIQVAINWVHTLPGVKRILVGPSRWCHLEENLGGIGWEMDGEDQRKLGKIIDCKAGEKKKKAIEITRQILSSESPTRQDLVFVIETLFSLELENEGVLKEFFGRIIVEGGSGGNLEIIKNELREKYLAKIDGSAGG